MSHDITFKNGLMLMVLSGTITPDDLQGIREALDAVESSHDVIPSRLLDLRSVKELRLTVAQVKAFVESRNNFNLYPVIKVAALIPGKPQLRLSRILQVIGENPKNHLRIFQEKDAALAWISTDNPAG